MQPAPQTIPGGGRQIADVGHTFPAEPRYIGVFVPLGCTMAESQFIKTETVRNGVLAKILIEKVSDYESTVLCNELNQVGEGARWRMVLDMSRVQLLTSAGIRVLITMHTAAAKNKGKFIIAGMSDELLELIKMTRLDKMFSMVKDSKKGVEAIA